MNGGEKNMATVVNNPGTNDSGSGLGMVLGIIVILAVALLFFVYGLPMLNQSSTPQVNVPGKVDVNVQGGDK